MKTQHSKSYGIQGKKVLRGKFIVHRGEHLQLKTINNLILHLKKSEKEKQIRPPNSRRNEILKIRAEISEIENKKAIKKMNKTKSSSFEKISKINKCLARLIRKKEREGPIKSEMKKDTTEIQRSVRDYYEQ